MSAFIRLDFPTLERQTNTTSARLSRKTFPDESETDFSKLASVIFMDESLEFRDVSLEFSVNCKLVTVI